MECKGSLESGQTQKDLGHFPYTAVRAYFLACVVDEMSPKSYPNRMMNERIEAFAVGTEKCCFKRHLGSHHPDYDIG